jgi:hypothetical protein
MNKRIAIPVLAFAAICALALVLAQESAAAGSLSVFFYCEPGFSGAFCEVTSPIGSGFSYSWSTTGRLTSSGPAGAPFRDAICWGSGSGSITVTVTASNGDRGSATRWFFCGDVF